MWEGSGFTPPRKLLWLGPPPQPFFEGRWPPCLYWNTRLSLSTLASVLCSPLICSSGRHDHCLLGVICVSLAACRFQALLGVDNPPPGLQWIVRSTIKHLQRQISTMPTPTNPDETLFWPSGGVDSDILTPPNNTAKILGRIDCGQKNGRSCPKGLVVDDFFPALCFFCLQRLFWKSELPMQFFGGGSKKLLSVISNFMANTNRIIIAVRQSKNEKLWSFPAFPCRINERSKDVWCWQAADWNYPPPPTQALFPRLAIFFSALLGHFCQLLNIIFQFCPLLTIGGGGCFLANFSIFKPFIWSILPFLGHFSKFWPRLAICVAFGHC